MAHDSLHEALTLARLALERELVDAPTVLAVLAEVAADPARDFPRALQDRRPIQEEELAALLSTGGSTVIERLASGAPLRAVRLTATAPEVTHDTPRLGRYPVTGALGAGGMGEILRVVDSELGREMAAKVCHGVARGEALEKFVREAQLTGQLEHPGIPPVHELGMGHDGRVYFTMKQVRGQDLACVLAAPAGGPSRAELLVLFSRICDAVAYAHSRGVIHRDLKPANVMVGAFGEVLVMDWGLARVLDGPDPASDGLALRVGDGQIAAQARGAGDAAPLVTQDGTVLGTPAYMPPEQARGEVSDLDERADVYALGAILYHLLTGCAPFEGATVWAVLEQVLDGALVRPTARAPQRDVPWELESVVLRAMAHDPAQRYPSVAALQADVGAYLDGRLLAAASYSPIQRAGKWVHRHRRGVAAIAAVLLAIVSVWGYGRWRARQDALADVAEASLSCQTVLEELPDTATLERTWRERVDRRRRREPDPTPSDAERDAQTTHISRALGAVAAMDRALRTSPESAQAIELRRRAGQRLGWFALVGGDHALAADAFGRLAAFGQSDPPAADLVLHVTADRRQVVELWKARTQDALADIEAGLARKGRPRSAAGLDDYMIEVSGYRHAEVAAVLSEALERVLARDAEAAEDRRSWSTEHIAWARFVLEALGRLGLAASVPPLARALDARAPWLTVAAGRALCLTQRLEANGPLLSLRNRIGVNAPRWLQIAPLLPRVPQGAVDAMEETADAYLNRGVLGTRRAT